MSKSVKFRAFAAAGAVAAVLAAGGAMLSPAGAAGVQPLLRVLAAVACTSTAPCQEYDNSGQGAGLKGTSSKGNGLFGVTNYNKLGATSGTAGVSGVDTALKTSLNSGVSGTSIVGTGVSGSSTSSAGISGSSTDAVGVTGTGALGGVFGKITSSDGNPEGGVHGLDVAPNTNVNAGVWGGSINGTGLEGNSQHFFGLLANGVYGAEIDGENTGLFVDGGNIGLQVSTSNGLGVEVFQGTGNVQAPLVLSSGVSGNPDSDAFESFDHNGTLLMKLTDTGDISILGQIFTRGVCNSGCAVGGKNVRRVVSYAPTEAEPTREDSGSAQLVGGKAYVRLDPAFVNVINARDSYLVFITPEGDSRGLFVTNKSTGGFGVRENMGGTSTLQFSYRVVAKPFGVNAPRLPMVSLPRAPSPSVPTLPHSRHA